MRITLVTALCLTSSLFGAVTHSVQLVPGTTGDVSFAGASYTRAALLNTSFRWEFRLNGNSLGANIDTPASRSEVFATNGSTFWVYVQTNGTLQATDWLDNCPFSDCNLTISLANRKDVIVRLVRDVANMKWWMELTDVDGTNYASSTVKTLTSLGDGPSSGGGTATVSTLKLGGASLNARIPWLRWHTGAAVAQQGMPTALDNVSSGYLGAWEFESESANSVADSSGHNNAMAMSGTRSYPTTWIYSPGCVAGTTKTFRVGSPAQLDGSRSAPLNDSAGLVYKWRIKQTPAFPGWAWLSDTTAMSPTFTPPVFGQYSFYLDVTDSDGQTSTCSVDHGAVATDANGVLVIPNKVHAWYFGQTDPDNPESGAGTPSFLSSVPDGTGIRAYPFFNSQVPINADAVWQNISVNVGHEWDTQLSGSISFTATCTLYSGIGSANCVQVNGVGTTFQDDFCGKDGDPTAPMDDTSIVVWYKSLLNGDTGSQRTGRRIMPIASCPSQTVLRLGRPGGEWSFITSAASVDGTVNTGVPYGRFSPQSGYWYNAGATGAYYDTPAGFYYLWYATGLDMWRDRARSFVDWWFNMPYNDSGAQYEPDAGYWLMGYGEARVTSLISMTLRATDGRPEMWPGIRKIANFVGPNNANMSGGVGDLRDSGYVTWWYGWLSLIDPDATERANWYTKLKNLYPTMWDAYAIWHGNEVWWNARDTGGGVYSTGLGGYLYTGTATISGKNVTGSGTNFLTRTHGELNGCMGKLAVTSATNASPVVLTVAGGHRLMAVGTVNTSGTVTSGYYPVNWVSGARFSWRWKDDGRIIVINGSNYKVTAWIDDTHIGVDAGVGAPNPGNQSGVSYTVNPGAVPVSIFGGTGSWSALNTGYQGWYYATPLTATTFSLSYANHNPVDTSSFGAMSGAITFAQGGGGHIWFTDSLNTDFFTSNRDVNGDQWAYRIDTVNSDTSITLVNPYTGPGGSKNYICVGNGPLGVGQGDSTIGTNVQPFMEAIAGQGHFWSREAGRKRSDTAFVTKTEGYVVAIGYFMQNHAFDAVKDGYTYFEVTPTAEHPDPDEHCFVCDSANGPGDWGGERINLVENLQALTNLCRFVPSTCSTAEQRWGYAYGKPGTGGASTDGFYADGMDHGWNNPYATYIQKWLGYVLGTGSNQTWLARRAGVGGLAPGISRTLYVAYTLGDHPSATQARLVLTDAAGNTTQSTCSASPCAIPADARTSMMTYRIDLLDGSGAVVLPGRDYPLGVQ